MTRPLARRDRARAFASALATSWTYEKLLPSEDAFEAATDALGDSCDLQASLPTIWPDWRTPAWYCRRDRGVDTEFVAAATGAAELLGGQLELSKQPVIELSRRIHRALFHRVWDEAGILRQGTLNVGVSWSFVPTALHELDADWQLWRSTEPITMAMARLHARFEQIHPFPDGNGRTGRLMCDLVLLHTGRSPAGWGAGRPDGRAKYLQALDAAFNVDMGPLAELMSGPAE